MFARQGRVDFLELSLVIQHTWALEAVKEGISLIFGSRVGVGEQEG
jgi:hypothetical protein